MIAKIKQLPQLTLVLWLVFNRPGGQNVASNSPLDLRQATGAVQNQVALATRDLSSVSCSADASDTHSGPRSRSKIHFHY